MKTQNTKKISLILSIILIIIIFLISLLQQASNGSFSQQNSARVYHNNMEKLEQVSSSLLKENVLTNKGHMISEDIQADQDAYAQIYYQNQDIGLNSNLLSGQENQMKKENTQEKKPCFSKSFDVQFSDLLNLKGFSQRDFREEIQELQLLSFYYHLIEIMVVKPQNIPLFQVHNFQKIKQQEKQCQKVCKIEQYVQNSFDEKKVSKLDIKIVVNSYIEIKEKMKLQTVEIRNKLQNMREKLQRQMKLTKNYEQTLHTCKICGQSFDNGRKLGGHMSRKHPGSSKEYLIKKEIYRAKFLQRNRRMYFKQNKIVSKQNQ